MANDEWRMTNAEDRTNDVRSCEEAMRGRIATALRLEENAERPTQPSHKATAGRQFNAQRSMPNVQLEKSSRAGNPTLNLSEFDIEC
jgi:hypothetical protein